MALGSGILSHVLLSFEMGTEPWQIWRPLKDRSKAKLLKLYVNGLLTLKKPTDV